MVDNTKIACALCAAFCAIAIGAYRLDAYQQSCCPGFNETAEVILNLVNTQSGASEFSKHHTLEQGYMRVIMWTKLATIRTWRGYSSTPPKDAPVLFNAAINFG